MTRISQLLERRPKRITVRAHQLAGSTMVPIDGIPSRMVEYHDTIPDQPWTTLDGNIPGHWDEITGRYVQIFLIDVTNGIRTRVGIRAENGRGILRAEITDCTDEFVVPGAVEYLEVVSYF